MSCFVFAKGDLIYTATTWGPVRGRVGGGGRVWKSITRDPSISSLEDQSTQTRRWGSLGCAEDAPVKRRSGNKAVPKVGGNLWPGGGCHQGVGGHFLLGSYSLLKYAV